MSKFYFLIFVLSVVTKLTPAQSTTEHMFPISVLENPINHSIWFDSIIPITYVPVFVTNEDDSKTILINGYAKSKILNDGELIRRLNSSRALGVEVVFSNYPINKEDWITNYYELLSQRLTELFRVDPTLNSASLEWRLVLQTSCKNAQEAEALFHGISIRFEPIQFLALNPIQPLPFPINIENLFSYEISSPNLSSNVFLAQGNEDFTSIEAILYPQSIYKRNIEHYLPPKVIRPNDPDCPTFQNRMQRPRLSLWERIFKR